MTATLTAEEKNIVLASVRGARLSKWLADNKHDTEKMRLIKSVTLAEKRSTLKEIGDWIGAGGLDWLLF